jgi:hypothetical protein
MNAFGLFKMRLGDQNLHDADLWRRGRAPLTIHPAISRRVELTEKFSRFPKPCLSPERAD